MALPSRDTENKIIAGVCAGLANSMEIDAMWVRLGFLAAFVLWGMGPLLYIILWFIMKGDK